MDRVAPSVVRIETIGGLERIGRVLFGTGPTTGVVVAPDGYVVSSAFNFIHRPASILIQLPDGTRRPAKLVATDHNRMIALLKFDAKEQLPVPEVMPEAEAKVGQWAIAVGRAFEVNQPNMAVGVVSALGRIWGKAIQTDAAVSPNNYGGPLLDIRGRVMGVLVPLSPQETSEIAGYEWYDSGIGFAIPFQKIQDLLPRLKQGKDLEPGVIGINFASPALFLADPVISACRPRSPAKQAGIKAGDRILQIDGRKTDLASQVKEELSRRYAGDKIRLTLLRDSKRLERETELVAKLEPFQHPFLGILPMRAHGNPRTGGATEQAKVEGNRTAGQAKPPAKAAEPQQSSGVTVRYVYPESPAAKAGIQRGDVLVAFAGGHVADADQLRTALADHELQEQVALEFRHGGEIRKVEVKLQGLPEAIPGSELPPAGEWVEMGKAAAAQRGVTHLKVPDFDAYKVSAYVPERYDTVTPNGLVIWLHGPAGLGEKGLKDLLARWKPICDREGLILLLPESAEKGKWQRSELRMLHRLLVYVLSNYAIDPTRVVVAGEEGGGAMAFDLALADRGRVRGVAAIEAGVSGSVPESEPAYRLAVYIARAQPSKAPAAIKETIGRLRDLKYPVTIKELDHASRSLTAGETSELARWIDTLDRL